jgi:glycogen operon protein
MTARHWETGYAKTMTVFLNGNAIAEPDTRGEQVRDDSFLLLFNAHHEPLPFTLPPVDYGELWESVLDTAMPVYSDRPLLKPGSTTMIESRSVTVLRRVS